MQMPDLVVGRYQVAFLKADFPRLESAVALAASTPGAEDLVANQDSFGSAYMGRLERARNRSEFAARKATQAGQRERAALFQSAAAVREAFFGNAKLARTNAAAATALSRGRDVEYGAAFARGLGGDASAAEATAEERFQRFPEDSSAQYYD